MRKAGFALLLLLAAGVMPALAEDDDKFQVTGEVRARWDYSENTRDFFDDTDDTFEFFPYRVVLGARGTFSENLSANVQFQNFGYFGNVTPPRDGGVIGQAFDGLGSESSETELYQGWLQIDEIGGTGFGLRLGRQEHALGNELHMGDNDFYNGQSFDGVRVMWDTERMDTNFFYYLVDEDAGSFVAPNFDDQRELYGVTVGFDMNDGKSRLEPYLLGIRNTADLAARESFWTIGALFNRPWADDQALDWSAEFAIQTGTLGTDAGGPATLNCAAGECDLAGWIGEATVGFTLAERHRFHVGGLYASGDDDATDSDDDSFQSIFPDLHQNNRLGNLDSDADSLSNIMDLYAGYSWIGEKNRLMAAVHNFALVEEGLGEDDLGNELDLTWMHTYSELVNFEVGLANLFVGDAQDAITAPDDADDAMRGWVQLQLKWN